MKKQLQLFLALLCLAACKPAELQYMDQLGRQVVLQRDTATIYAGLQKEGMLVLPKIEKTYFWYEKGRINSSQGAYSGKVLHGQYRLYDRTSKRPLESGKFRKGLKTGRWLHWRSSGQLLRTEIYTDGLLNGNLIRYDSLGRANDTLHYRMGSLLPEKARRPADSTGTFSKIKRFFQFHKK